MVFGSDVRICCGIIGSFLIRMADVCIAEGMEYCNRRSDYCFLLISGLYEETEQDNKVFTYGEMDIIKGIICWTGLKLLTLILAILMYVTNEDEI